MKSADYPNLKRYRVKRIDGQFQDAEKEFSNEYSVGGLKILNEKLLPATWTVYTSGIDILISERYRREWQPVSHRTSAIPIWPNETVHKHRNYGVSIYTETIPVVIIATLRATRCKEIAIASTLLQAKKAVPEPQLARTASIAALIEHCFKVPRNSEEESEIWIVQHQAKTPYFAPYTTLPERRQLDAQLSRTSKNSGPGLVWNLTKSPLDRDITYNVIDATSILSKAFAKLSADNISKRYFR